MLEFVLGNETFQKGIRNYLNKYKYKTVVTNNLWDELDRIWPQVNIQLFVFILLSYQNNNYYFMLFLSSKGIQ